MPRVGRRSGTDGDSNRLSSREQERWQLKDRSLRSVQIKLIKIGARLVRHARRLVFQFAEVAVPREVFWQVLQRIAGLHPAPG